MRNLKNGFLAAFSTVEASGFAAAERLVEALEKLALIASRHSTAMPGRSVGCIRRVVVKVKLGRVITDSWH